MLRLSPPMLLIASKTFWPSARTPRTTRSETEVALRASRQRPTHPAGIGAGQIRARDQRIGGQRPALVGAQRLALPFRRLALGRGQPGARHRDLDRPECACQRPRAATVAMARNAGFAFIAGHLASLVTRSRQHGVKL